jgi:hypothetical protein
MLLMLFTQGLKHDGCSTKNGGATKLMASAALNIE